MQNTYEAKETANGTHELVRNGTTCLCPKVVFPMPQQGTMGSVQMGLMRLPCSTVCPLASIENAVQPGDTAKTYVIRCEGQEKAFELKQIIEFKKTQQPPIIKL